MTGERRSLLAAALVWLIGSAAAPVWASPILIHQSTENLYDTGGTQILGCNGSGCSAPSFSFGNVSGTVQWQVQEKVFEDVAAGTTTFSYTVFNDVLPNPIMSFHLGNNGFQGIGTAPANWAFSQNATEWKWDTADLASGIPLFNSLDTMTVTLAQTGLGITFSQASFDDANGLYTFPDWRASSPTPEPGTLMLLGSGLTGLAFLAIRRRKAR
jgi:hypothetical protein